MSIFSHRHAHEPTAVQVAPAGPFSPKITIVLWRCECGDLNTQDLRGEWTLSQVRGEREPTNHERIETDLLLAGAKTGTEENR